MSRNWLHPGAAQTHIPELLTSDYYTVEVSFDQRQEDIVTSRHYTYKVDNSLVIKEGDLVVAYANNEYKIVRVIKVKTAAEIDFSANYEYKYIAAVLDFTKFIELNERTAKLKAMVVEMSRNQLKKELLTEFTASLDTADVKRINSELGLNLPDLNK